MQDRIASASELVAEIGRLARPLRLPTLADTAGELLRELDKRRLLGTTLLVVGTNCIPAYSIEAAGAIADAPDETEDFDLTWAADEQVEDILREAKFRVRSISLRKPCYSRWKLSAEGRSMCTAL